MKKNMMLPEAGLLRYRKQIFLLAGGGFFLGILAANTFGKKAIMELGIFGDYFFMQMQNVKIDSNAMFWYVFEKRMLFILAVMLFSVTSLGIAAAYMLSAWVGISAGLLLSAAAMQQGMQGIALCMAGLIPHYLFYIPAGVILLVKACQLSGRLHGREQMYQNHIRKELTAFLLVSLGVFCIFFLGVLLESLLNPVFLQKFYKFFNNM